MCVLLTSCIHKEPTVASDLNPMPVIWATIRNEIEVLETKQAAPDQWARKAESSERIFNKEQLTHTVAHLTLPVPEKERLLMYLSSSTQAIHYGFEGNYHALVFFDAQNKPSHVLKW